MALFGSLSTVRSQAALSPHFEAAFAYLAEALTPGSAVNQRILAVAIDRTDRIELGGGVFVLEQAYHAKPRAEGRFEAHRKYIDLQGIISGNEVMEVTETSRLTVQEDLTPGRDVIFFEDVAGASVLQVRAGDVAVFFPIDAHMPSVAAGAATLVHKAVVKVPVSG
jgi:biofilm protein TabA